MSEIEFEWDPKKAAANLEKHGLRGEDDVIRIISARRATPGEQTSYEAQVRR